MSEQANQDNDGGSSNSVGEGWLRNAYDEYGAAIYRLCRITLPRHLADEATQDVFIDAWRKRQQYDPARGPLAAWLFGIAKHRVIDLARSEQRHSTRRSDLDDDASPPDHDEIERLANRSLLAHALNRLPERQRTAISLAYVQGLTHHQIADRTGTALGTVKSDIRRGLSTLRTVIDTEQDGGET